MIDRGVLATDLINALLQPGVSGVAVTTGLHGAGGFGKTCLAAWACYQANIRNRFTGGILWVTVGSEKGGTELAECINDLSYHLTGERPGLADPFAAGVELGRRLDIVGEPVLLVVDDVWNETQLLPFRQGGSLCRRLITTRVSTLFPDGSTQIKVDAMTAHQAAQMARAGIDGLSDNFTDELVRLTGAWPVLLSLVNGSLAVRIERGQATDEAACQVIDRLGAHGPAAFDLARPADRSQAVAATINASLALLSDDDRDRYLDVAIFAEDVEIPVDVLMLLWPQRDVDAFCDELTRLGLAASYRLDSPGARLRLHDVVRAYLLRLRTAQEHADVHVRLVNAIASMCADESDDRSPWWNLPREQRFLWVYLISHMIQAGRRDLAAAALADNRWLEASILACGSTLPVEADLGRIGGAWAEALALAIRRISHMLMPSVSPQAIGSTLLNRIPEDPNVRKLGISLGWKLDTPHLRSHWKLPDIDAPDLARLFEGDAKLVNCCAFSPDGVLIVSGDSDGVVRIWNVDTGTQRTFAGHRGGVNGCVFIDGGTRIVSVSDDSTARVWDIATGDLVSVLEGHKRRVTGCAGSPDGRLLATTGSDRVAHIWDIDTGKPIAALRGHTNSVNACAFSPDGRLLATVSTDKTARIWTVDNATLQLTLHGHKQALWDCAFTPDGRLLATASTDRSTRVWDTSAGQHVASVRGHSTAHRACQFSPDGSVLATTSNDDTIKIWDATTWKHRRTLIGHTDDVVACSFAPTDSLLATAGHDATVRLWDLTPQDDHQRGENSAPTSAVSFSPDGLLLASATAGNVGDDRYGQIRDVATGQRLHALGFHYSPTQSCAFNADGHVVATGASHQLKMWSANSAGLVGIQGVYDRVDDCTFSRDGRHLACTTDAGPVLIWQIRRGWRRSTLIGHGAAVRACEFSPDGQLLASAADDGTVRLWNVSTRSEMVTLGNGNSPLLCCAFSPNGRHLAYAGEDGIVTLYNTPEMRLDVELFLPTSVWGCGFSSDSRLLATVGRDCTLRVWDVEQEACVAAVRLAGPGNDCEWHPSAPYIAVGGRNGIYMFEYVG